MKKNIIYLFLITQIFAFGGFGLYLNSDMVSVTPPSSSSSDGSVSITPQEMSNPLGLGGFVYLDVLPVIDIEFSAELVGKQYPFVINTLLTDKPYDFAWGRFSLYSTVRKKIIGSSIPFLAKAQVYGGLGINAHWITPDVTVDFIEGAFPDYDGDGVAADQDFTDTELMNTLKEYMNDNMRTSAGIHVQLGAQAKLLFVNLFINARYTIAKDVVNGTSGFPSVWTGLAIGL